MREREKERECVSERQRERERGSERERERGRVINEALSLQICSQGTQTTFPTTPSISCKRFAERKSKEGGKERVCAC